MRQVNPVGLRSAGGPLPVVQKGLGHKSIQVTVDVHQGLLFQTHEVADPIVERALGGKTVLVSARGTADASRGAARRERVGVVRSQAGRDHIGPVQADKDIVDGPTREVSALS